jgi:site-specific recombinase XerD
MSSLAPTLEAFFTQRLHEQRDASPNTVAGYRDAWRLLLGFAHQQTGKIPSQLDLADLDAPLIGAFLTHLEQHRNNSVRTRNARLAAIHSLFTFAALRHPEHAALIQRVLAIPHKRADSNTVSFLTLAEIEALLAAVDQTTTRGRRDHALLLVAIQAGLRVSELAALLRKDVQLGAGAHLRVHGKGRKQRCTPLTTQTVKVLRDWLTELNEGPDTPIFAGPRGAPLGRDAIRRLVAKHATTARRSCPSLTSKNVTPHVLRHTAAMQLLQAGGVDTSVIALWLGHESTRSTQIYLHADLALKQRALDRVVPPQTNPGRYTPPDALLAFLEDL